MLLTFAGCEGSMIGALLCAVTCVV